MTVRVGLFNRGELIFRSAQNILSIAIFGWKMKSIPILTFFQIQFCQTVFFNVNSYQILYTLISSMKHQFIQKEKKSFYGSTMLSDVLQSYWLCRHLHKWTLNLINQIHIIYNKIHIYNCSIRQHFSRLPYVYIKGSEFAVSHYVIRCLQIPISIWALTYKCTFPGKKNCIQSVNFEQFFENIWRIGNNFISENLLPSFYLADIALT